MANRYFETTYTSAMDEASLQVGLQRHYTKIYGLMSLALLVSGAVSYGLAQYIIGQIRLGDYTLYNSLFGGFKGVIVMFLPLIAVIFMGAMAERASAGTLRILFFVTAIAFGVTDSVLFFIYPMTGIIQTFFVTSGVFAAMALYGITTKRDLSGVGRIAFIGLIGLIIASLVNILFSAFWVGYKPDAMNFAISFIGVIVFSGLIMYRNQEIKVTYAHHVAQGTEDKAATFAALGLFISFINLFRMLLYFFGGSRD